MSAFAALPDVDSLGVDESTLHATVPPEGQHYLIVLYPKSGLLCDDQVGNIDALLYEIVDAFAQLPLRIVLGHVGVDLADLELQPPDSISHRKAHRATGDKIVYLRVEDMRCQVACQCVSRRRRV